MKSHCALEVGHIAEESLRVRKPHGKNRVAVSGVGGTV